MPFARVRMVMGDTATCVDQGPTVGSLTIALAGPQLRQAAADGRQALLALAATHLDVAAGKLTVEDGVVSAAGDASRRVSYGELVDGRLLGVAIPVKPKTGGFGLALGGAKPKAASEYKIVGQSVARVDIPPKVTGQYFYIQDVRVPGMLHGRVIRPPGLGSRLLSHGKPSHGARVVRLKNFLGVVAEREWDAIQAAQDLKVKWSHWAGLPTMDNLYTYIRETPSLQDTVVAKHRRRRQGAGCGTAAVRRVLHDRGPDARLDRPLLRGRRRQATTPPRSGRGRRAPTSCVRRSPTRSTCRSRRCTSSPTRPRGATAGTGRTRPPSTRR